MANLEWKESYSVGVKSLDNQHKHLLDLVNQFAAIDVAKPDTKRTFAALNALVEYAQVHFDTEELYLKQHEYPTLAQQQREHVGFTAHVFQLAQRLEQSDPRVHIEILDFVKDWYISHILGTDREYIDFLKSKGVT